MEQELQFLLYDLPDESAKVQVVVRDETVWMTQKAMGVLFGVQAPAISKHLKNIFESGELNPEVVISKMETTTQHGAIAGKTQTSETNFYNLVPLYPWGSGGESACRVRDLQPDAADRVGFRPFLGAGGRGEEGGGVNVPWNRSLRSTGLRSIRSTCIM